MKNIPRILPLIGVAIGGVLAINALAGAKDLPDLVSGARAFAEDAVKAAKPDKAKTDKAKVQAGRDGAAKDVASPDAPAVGAVATDASAIMPAAKPQAVCAPTAAELAKEAGLSPAELKVLQSLGERRGELDARENDMSTQLALMAAAEAKLDAKVQALNGLKGDIQGLLTAADGKEQAEIDRLVIVFQGMKPKDAAPRMVLLDDSVKVPIAAKMKERALSAILAQMPPADAKKLTESLAKRFSNAKTLAANAQATEDAAAATPATADAKAAPAKSGKRAAAGKKGGPRKAAPASKEAAADPAKPAATPAAAAPAPKAG